MDKCYFFCHLGTHCNKNLRLVSQGKAPQTGFWNKLFSSFLEVVLGVWYHWGKFLFRSFTCFTESQAVLGYCPETKFIWMRFFAGFERQSPVFCPSQVEQPCKLLQNRLSWKDEWLPKLTYINTSTPEYNKPMWIKVAIPHVNDTEYRWCYTCWEVSKSDSWMKPTCLSKIPCRTLKTNWRRSLAIISICSNKITALLFFASPVGISRLYMSRY